MNYQTRLGLTAMGAALAVSLIPSAAMAYHTSTLWLKNVDDQPVTMTLSTDNNNCYEGTPQLGQVWENVAPGDRVKMVLSRVGGHGCNGRQGEFEIVFDPGAGGSKTYTTQHFDFDNEGGLELTPRPNSYRGMLAKTGDHEYTYTTFKPKSLGVTGPTVGTWKLICQQICNRTTTEQKAKEHTTSTRLSRETKSTITASLEAGVEMEGVGSAKSTIETSLEKSVSQEMAESFTSGEINIDVSNYVFTPEQMKGFDIFAIWQWVATTSLSDGSNVMIGSNKFTCTPDAVKPTYYPGSPEDLKACRGK